MTSDEQLAYLTKGCVDVVRAAELRLKLERAAASGRPLVVKVGFDPTAPDLHLGHTVLLRKMKHFQDLGHTVIFLIGDFTGLIGDPTGRKTRPPMTREEIQHNAETYKAQVFKILDPRQDRGAISTPSGSRRWASTAVIRLAAQLQPVADARAGRLHQALRERTPIALHELIYPLAQGYDSVRLECDVELGGTDQTFNLIVGRELQRAYGQPRRS